MVNTNQCSVPDHVKVINTARHISEINVLAARIEQVKSSSLFTAEEKETMIRNYNARLERLQ